MGETDRSQAWAIFDRIVADAAPDGVHSNPWLRSDDGESVYEPDFDVLVRLLGVPLYLRAGTQSGVPALALDVWLSYELRRAGFDRDAVWPRPQAPRVLPAAISNLIKSLPTRMRAPLVDRIEEKSSITGATAASANFLGKNYRKQVDVSMSDWSTGPELLISTKRMDSSLGKNAANRVEESYGDAKNLRLRHPMAALGFYYGLRSAAIDESPEKAAWLIDLLQKLGEEDDAYHACALLVMEYGDHLAVDSDGDGEGEDRLAVAGFGEDNSAAEAIAPDVDESAVDAALAALPAVSLRHERVPDSLSSGRFLAMMVRRVLAVTPVNMHAEARTRLRDAR